MVPAAMPNNSVCGLTSTLTSVWSIFDSIATMNFFTFVCALSAVLAGSSIRAQEFEVVPYETANNEVCLQFLVIIRY